MNRSCPSAWLEQLEQQVNDQQDEIMCNQQSQIKGYTNIVIVQLPPHLAGSNLNASRARFWHSLSAISMYLTKERQQFFNWTRSRSPIIKSKMLATVYYCVCCIIKRWTNTKKKSEWHTHFHHNILHQDILRCTC